MEINESFFWMNGLLASELCEVTTDISRLDTGGFWAVSISFEGEAICARFGSVARDQPFPHISEWSPLRSTWRSSLDEDSFEAYVQEIRHYIEDGIVYQANACRVLATEVGEISIASLFSKLLESNPAPYAAFLRIPELEIASASPELFLARNCQEIQTSPIKGTQDVSDQKEFGEKDQSENIMIVDLMRNDLSRICEIGSVQVSDFLRVESHPGIRHLVSDVKGTLRGDVSWKEIAQALLPAGSVSGTPKESAIEIIAKNEPLGRNVYCGVLGWIDGDQALLNVAIRTFWKRGTELSFGTGGGITWPSDPHEEWRETQLKANHLIGIAGGMDSDGWQFGEGIFETLLVSDGVPLLLDLHLARAIKSSRELSIEMPSRDQILESICSLEYFDLARLRLSFGKQFSFSLSEYTMPRQPMRILIKEESMAAGIGSHKVFPYWKNIDLLRSAHLEQCDEVLLIDQKGVVGEGATCNYLFKIKDRWVTPPISSGVLPGIMRGLAVSLGLAIEQEVLIADLKEVEAMVALSSLRICTPISALGNRVLRTGAESDLLFEILWSAAQAGSID